MGQPALRLIPPAPPSGARAKRDTTASEVALPSDAELVAEVLDGRGSAFELLYRRHVAFALGLAARLQGNASDVEDLVHDAFLRAHAQLRGLRDPAAFRSWLGSIVVSQVRMRLRKTRLLRVLGLASGSGVELDSLASPAASPEVRAELAQIYALMRVMPADERIAWTLRNVEHHRLEEVAQLTSCSLATAKRRILRAQRFLREHFVSSGSQDPRSDEGDGEHD